MIFIIYSGEKPISQLLENKKFEIIIIVSHLVLMHISSIIRSHIVLYNLFILNFMSILYIMQNFIYYI